MPEDPRMADVRARLPAHRLLLLVIALAALILRFYGQNWDDGRLFHPDERHILMVSHGLNLPQPLTLQRLLSVDSPLNPKSFAYGSVSFYLLRGTSVAAAWVGSQVPALASLANADELDESRLVGRTLSALFDVGTVLLVYVLGRRLFGRWVGVLASSLVALAPLHVQLSHFFASDTLLTFFITAILVGLTGMYQERRTRWTVLTGAALGLALASKVSAAPVLAAIAATYLLRLLAVEKDGRLLRRSRWTHEVAPTVRSGALLAAIAAITFVVISPYALIDIRTFVQHVAEQNLMARGTADLPYTRQFANRPVYLYFLQNLTVFGLGPPLGIAALAGWLFVIVRGARRPTFAEVLLLAWTVPYFAITGQFHAKFLRYMLPITPVLCLFAAVGLARLWAVAPTARRWTRPAAEALIAVVVGLTALYALAYLAIYSRPHTAVEASLWIYANVAPGSTIATEHWEEGMPVAVKSDGRQLDSGVLGYKTISLNLYEPDDAAKLAHIATTLDQADYVVFFSNRLYGTIPRLPERYPLTTEYYRLLFGEKLGYELVGAFTSYPMLLGAAFLDDTLAEPGLPAPALLAGRRVAPLEVSLGHADESFSVYDHPKVLVFRKTERLGSARIAEILRPALGNRSPAAPLETTRYKSLMESPAELEANTAGGTYRELFDPAGLANQVPLLVWVLLVQVLGLAAAPIAFAAAPRLADRGYLLAKTLGALGLAWLSWIVVALGPLPNGAGVGLLALAAVLVAGAGALYFQRADIPRFVRERWRVLAAGEVVFWVAFALYLVIRLHNPDLWHPARGGEKPMDLAYLMAAIKTTTYPPYDPWFAGGVLNYYYFGQVFVAALVRLTGIVPTTAYNLVIPYLFALTAGGAFSVGSSLVDSSRGWRRPIAAGVLASLFVGVIGNLGGGLQLADLIARLSASAPPSAIPGLAPFVRLLGGLIAVVGGQPLVIPPDWYWPSTRVIEGTINEFPFFTFLYADLHAHMIALPMTLLALGLALSVARGDAPRFGLAGTNRDRVGLVAPAAIDVGAVLTDLRGRALAGAVGRALLAGVVLALAVGALFPTNSWDYPTYLGITALAHLVPWYRSPGRTGASLFLVGARFTFVTALSYLLYLPFHQRFQSFYSGVEPFPDKSPIDGYLVIHGFLLAGLLTFVVRDLASRLGDLGAFRFAGLCLREWDRLPRVLELHRRLVVFEDEVGVALAILGFGVAAVGVFLGLLGMPLVGLLFCLLVVVGGLALRRDRPVEESFLLVLVGTGLALGIATELVAIDGDVGRMNTVFKFYFQVWVLWSIAAAVAVVRSWDWLLRRARGRVWLGVLGFLLALSLIYPIVATPARLRDRYDTSVGPTLDGTAYMRTARQAEEATEFALADDLAAIQWLQQHVAGSPVILEGQAPIYHWGSRISIYTGLPTVIGWDWHQTQQRWGFRDEIEERKADVRKIYADPTSAASWSLVAKYRIEYIVVGALERAYYPPSGLAALDQLIGTRLDLAYDGPGARIYRVRATAR